MERDVTPALKRFLAPRSIALVGVSERSTWARFAVSNLERCGFDGDIHLVNRRGEPLFGRPTHTRCVDIGRPVDAALILTPNEGAAAAVQDAGAAGAAGAVVLSSGFAEAGEEGARRQVDLLAAARQTGVRLLGPNCLGFVNMEARAPLWTGPLQRPAAGGRIAIVSQSGAVAAHIQEFASLQSIQLAALISTGNEADLDVADLLDHFADGDVGAVGLFIETVRRPDAFRAAAVKARENGKVVVVLKVGRSEVTATAAAAHTGALVGDDRVFSAVCGDLGLIRVDSIEQLVITTDLAARMRRPTSGGLGLIAMSGGIAEIAADQLIDAGADLPPLGERTRRRLLDDLPGFGTPHNPLDVTGGAVADPAIFGHAVAALADDPALGLIGCVFDAPHVLKAGDFRLNVMRRIKQEADGVDKPVIVMSNAMSHVSSEIRAALDDVGVTYVGAGISVGLQAAHRLASAPKGRPAIPRHEQESSSQVRPADLGTERKVLDYLAEQGVPSAPAIVAASREAADAASRTFGGRVVMKVLSPDIAHKTDVGGVALDLDPRDVADRYDRMIAEVRQVAPEARIEGVLISPMRRGGVELLVGIVRDPAWGPVLSVGLGGALVEIADDVSMRMLPIGLDDAGQMLDELRCARLLGEFRGRPAVDRRALVEAIVAISNAALRLGDSLGALEVNPLMAREDGVEALDGLVIALA